MIPRSVAICKKYNIRISHEARQVKPQDFRTFKDSTAVVNLWGAYDDGKSIEDPYYGGVVSRNTFIRV